MGSVTVLHPLPGTRGPRAAPAMSWDGMRTTGKRSRRRREWSENWEGFSKWLLSEMSGQELEVKCDPSAPWEPGRAGMDGAALDWEKQPEPPGTL